MPPILIYSQSPCKACSPDINVTRGAFNTMPPILKATVARFNIRTLRLCESWLTLEILKGHYPFSEYIVL